MNKKLIVFLLVVSCSIKSMETEKLLEEIIDIEKSSNKLVKDVTINKLLQLKKEAEEKNDLNKAITYRALCRSIIDARKNSGCDIQIQGLRDEQLKLVPEGFMYIYNNKHWLDDTIAYIFSNAEKNNDFYESSSEDENQKNK